MIFLFIILYHYFLKIILHHFCSRYARANKYRTYYNNLPREVSPNVTSSIYDFVDELPSDIISYKSFRQMLKLNRSISNKKEREKETIDKPNKSYSTTLASPHYLNVERERRKKFVVPKFSSKSKVRS